MIRLFIVILLTLSIPFTALAQAMRPMNEVTIVALIITSGEETQVSRRVTETLESLDAQTLTANAPNASEMRSILKRFASAAIDTDVALVYYDGSVLNFGGREFVAPGGIELKRPSDLLTKAIPLSALARATALAINGGAVLVHASGQNVTLIDGVTLVEAAPAPRMGTSPILFASAFAAQTLADGLNAMAATDGNIELNTALAGLADIEGVSISQLPTGTIMLRNNTSEQLTDTALTEVFPETTEAAVEMAEAMAETGVADPENTGMALPQVEPVAPPVVEEDGSYAASVADTVEALEAANAESVPIIEDPAESTNAAEAEETAANEVEAEPVLSLEVLRAMQGALSRSEKRSLQQNLRALGHYRGLIDGIFGPQTERAIAAYQDSISVEVTGVLTPTQLEALSQ